MAAAVAQSVAAVIVSSLRAGPRVPAVVGPVGVAVVSTNVDAVEVGTLAREAIGFLLSCSKDLHLLMMQLSKTQTQMQNLHSLMMQLSKVLLLKTQIQMPDPKHQDQQTEAVAMEEG